VPSPDPAAARTRYRIDLAYDGAPYAGFARQPGFATVQGRLEDALVRILGHPAPLVCAGRTDRGVHALAQVVHLDVDPTVERAARATRDLEVLRSRLDQQAGRGISVWSVREVGAGFHARFSAVSRRYRYRLVDAPVADPIRRGDRWQIEGPLDVAAIRAAAPALVGEHDFASFCRRAPGRTTRRRINRITLSRPLPGHLDIVIDGSAFCHQQVRAIGGRLVEVGRGREHPAWVGEVLEARDRAVAARVAPAHGLTLERVSYGRSWPAAPPPEVRALLRDR